MMFLKDRHTFCSASIFSLQMLAIMPSSGGLPTFMLRREEQKQRIIWGKLMIKGKLALITCAMALAF
ncbi:ABC transporter substrate-binding protein, partial [Salmonella enterica]